MVGIHLTKQFYGAMLIGSDRDDDVVYAILIPVADFID